MLINSQTKFNIMAFKIIKKKDFTFEKDGAQVSGTHYTVAYKGRVFGASSLRFDDGDLEPSADGKSLTIKGNVDIKKEHITDQLTGEVVATVYSLYPQLDLKLAEL